MADNYLQFSELLANLTIPEEAWLARELKMIYVFGNREYEEDQLPDELDPANADWQGCRNNRDLPGIDSDDDTDCGFEYEFEGERGESKDGGRCLWFHSEYGAEIDRLAHLVRKFLRKFRPHAWWSLSYAQSCSKPRVGEFGGGAVFVTARTIKWNDSGDFVTREAKAFEQRISKRKKRATRHRKRA